MPYGPVDILHLSIRSGRYNPLGNPSKMGKMGNLKVPEGFSLGTEQLGTAEGFPRPIEEALVRFGNPPGSYGDTEI